MGHERKTGSARGSWRSALFAAAAVAAVGTTGGAAAQEKFPSRPITIFIPYAAGGPNDAHFRVLTTHMQKTLGVPFVLENKPGAGASLGPATMAATAKPDGYTLSQLPAGIFSVPVMQKVTFDPSKDFTYIIRLSGYRLMAMIHPDASWKTFQDFVADVKANPNTVVYGSSGVGAGAHLVMESLSLALGLKLRQVPFRGTSEAVAAFLGKHVQITIVAGNFLNLIDSGQARPLLYITYEKSTRFPQAPTLVDAGTGELALDPSVPYGLGGPKGMDPAVVRILHDAAKAAMGTPEHKAILDQLDQSDRYLDSAGFTAFALKQAKEYQRVLPLIGLGRKD